MKVVDECGESLPVLLIMQFKKLDIGEKLVVDHQVFLPQSVR